MVLVGALVLASSALVLAWRDGNPALVRLGYRSLLLGALPAWMLMRVGAEWIASKEGYTDSNATWIGIGQSSADLGLLLSWSRPLLAGLAVRRTAALRSRGPWPAAPRAWSRS